MKYKEDKHQDYKKFEKFAKKESLHRNRTGKKTKSKENLEDGFDLSADNWAPLIQKGYFAARIVEVHKKYVFVSREDNEGEIDTTDVWIGTVARKYLLSTREERNFFAVGDRVLCLPSQMSERPYEVSQELPSCMIEHRQPRRAKIARVDPMIEEREHVLATNMTQLVIVASYRFPDCKWALIDRFIVLAEEEGLKFTLILNKRDLLEALPPDDPFVQECMERKALYESLGYRLLSTQTLSPSSKEKQELKNVFAGEISLISGHSGVGKSSIVNLLRPEIEQDVEDEEIFKKGRHTTSYASFIKLNTGGYVIDTPGIRSFVLPKRTPFELSWGFIEMRTFLENCKYKPCSHDEEPFCQVKAAVEAGSIHPARYRSYLNLLRGESVREGRKSREGMRNQGLIEGGGYDEGEGEELES